MRRPVAESLPLYGDLHRFIPALAVREGHLVDEVAVPQHPNDARMRLYGPAVYLRRLLDVASFFFLAKFTEKPLRFFGLVGSVFFVLGGDHGRGPAGRAHRRPGHREPSAPAARGALDRAWASSCWASGSSAKSSCISGRRTAARTGCARGSDAAPRLRAPPAAGSARSGRRTPGARRGPSRRTGRAPYPATGMNSASRTRDMGIRSSARPRLQRPELATADECPRLARAEVGGSTPGTLPTPTPPSAHGSVRPRSMGTGEGAADERVLLPDYPPERRRRGRPGRQFTALRDGALTA